MKTKQKNNTNQRTALLKKTTIFSHLKNEELAIIAQNSETIKYAKGERVFTAGQKSHSLYIVDTGEVYITRETQEGKQVDIARFTSGGIFGEMDMLQGRKYDANAIAEDTTILLVFPHKGLFFHQFIEEFPIISAQIVHRFLVIIADRIRKTNKLLTENSPLVQELHRQVYGDKLTGLYNRTYLEENLGKYLNEENGPTTLLMVKPDNFKAINDSFGHEAGDQALCIMADALAEHLSAETVLVRFMGNEFGIVLRHTDRERALREADGIKTMLNQLNLDEITHGADFNLSVSTGIALYPEHAAESNALIEKAHALPLVGRSRGGNKILFPEDA